MGKAEGEAVGEFGPVVGALEIKDKLLSVMYMDVGWFAANMYSISRSG